MKLIPLAVLLAAACASTTGTVENTATNTEMPGIVPAPRVDEHAWLQQLVGEWTMKSETTMGPGQDPIHMESTESVRSIGGLWVIAEGKATFNGMSFTSLLTLGYDPEQKAYVGTWIDTLQTHLWTYRGELDAAKRVLSLSAEGPSFDDPSKLAKYRDAIELVSADHKVLTSSVMNDDGTWTTFLRADYRRKK